MSSNEQQFEALLPLRFNDMTDTQLSALLNDLIKLSQETEWVEFKKDYMPGDLGPYLAEYVSALANSAALIGKDSAYLIWGVEDGTRKVVGTRFVPRQAKQGSEEIENWLMRSLNPQVNLKIHEWTHQGKRIVLFEIPKPTYAPVRFGSEEFIRVGSLKKKLKDYPAKEAELWASFAKIPFEKGISKADLAGDDVLTQLDFTVYFDLLKKPLPSHQNGILDQLANEAIIVHKPGGRFDITNLGAILFAKNLTLFDRLSRKTLRVIKYQGRSRTKRNVSGVIRLSRKGMQLPSRRQLPSSIRNSRIMNRLDKRSAPKYACIQKSQSVNL